jgi:hypothetical protein
MNKETLQARLVEVEARLQQGMANINMYIGQKEELMHWLRECEAKDVSSDSSPEEVVEAA